jgi:hypothetical protein
MAEINYEKNLITRPLFEVCSGVKNRQSPAMTYLSSVQVPEANYYVEFGWITGIPTPNPHVPEHVHAVDEIVFHFGTDPHVPQDLGADIEYYIGGQPIVFNTTTAVFIPKGVPHGPLTWKAFRKPHIQMSVLLGSGTPQYSWDKNNTLSTGTFRPQKTVDFDYEQYVVRSPYREVGGKVKNRQMPTMTFMSRHQVIGANYYSELGWITGMPDPNPHVNEHTHTFDEIVLHFGNNPDSPQDMGGEIEYYLEGQKLVFNTNSAIYVPRGMKHGPLIWKSFKRPLIEMTIIVGAGTFKEVWSREALDAGKTKK